MLPDAAAIRAVKDPARRLRAARAAADAARRVFATIEAQAAAELAADHRDIPASAHEVRIDLQEFAIKAEGLDHAAGFATNQIEPARRFESQEDAEDALRDYGLRLDEVTDELGPLVLGAAAVGVPWQLVHEHTRTRPDALACFLPASGSVEVAAPVDAGELETFARWITTRARALMDAATTWAEGCEAQIWDMEARRFVANCTPMSLNSAPADARESSPEASVEELAAYLNADTTSGEREKNHTLATLDRLTDPDAWLSMECAGLEREAARIRERRPAGPGAEYAVGQVATADAFTELAGAFRHLRRTGQAPST